MNLIRGETLEGAGGADGRCWFLPAPRVHSELANCFQSAFISIKSLGDMARLLQRNLWLRFAFFRQDESLR